MTRSFPLPSLFVLKIRGGVYFKNCFIHRCNILLSSLFYSFQDRVLSGTLVGMNGLHSHSYYFFCQLRAFLFLTVHLHCLSGLSSFNCFPLTLEITNLSITLVRSLENASQCGGNLRRAIFPNCYDTETLSRSFCHRKKPMQTRSYCWKQWVQFTGKRRKKRIKDKFRGMNKESVFQCMSLCVRVCERDRRETEIAT